MNESIESNGALETIGHDQAIIKEAIEETLRKLSPQEQALLISRLLVGGLSVGYDELLNRLQNIDQQLLEESAKYENGTIQFADQHELEIATSSKVDFIRLALTGLVFDLQRAVPGQVSNFRRLEGWVYNKSKPILNLFFNNPAGRYINDRVDSLADRGQSIVERWVEIGHEEDPHNQLLAKNIFIGIVDSVIEYLAANPEVQELVQTQSTTLATEMVEEVRERTVSADTFMEGLARAMLRRVPRSTIAGPSDEVRIKAVTPRMPKPEIEKK